MNRSAIISECGYYRYELSRHWGDPASNNILAMLMLNPSTADANLDDPTIRRCIGFAHREGCDGLVVANLYALRSTDPRACLADPKRIGPANDSYLQRLADEFPFILCAWGAHAEPDRVRDVMRILRHSGLRLGCLGTTKGGHPRHPLYLHSTTKIVPYLAPGEAA